jgi:hypothetical protein
MKSRNFVAVILTMVIAIAITSCGKKEPTGSSPALEKSSVVIMKANAKQNLMVGTNDVPVPGGSLDIQSALFSIEKLRIEENSGFEGEHEGEHQDSENDNNDVQEAADMVVTGPFSLDISKGETFIDSVAVYPGTFKNVDLTFMMTATSPFDNKSIVIKGDFTPTNGSAIPFTLKSEYLEEIQCHIAGDSITVKENTIIPIVVTFDLAGFFKDLDFSNAQVVNREIWIDSTYNSGLLMKFETNLSNYVDVEEESNEPQ